MATATMPAEDLVASAASEVPIPLEVYLDSMYRPDLDYLDGRLLERNVGEKPHARLQKHFILAFSKQETEWQLEILPEQRVQVGPSRYRVADLCVTRLEQTADQLIVREPPLLCIEILSREDRMSEMQERVEDYLGMGVKTVWLIDPWRRKAFAVGPSGGIQPISQELVVDGTAVRISIAEVFEAMDRYAAKAL